MLCYLNKQSVADIRHQYQMKQMKLSSEAPDETEMKSSSAASNLPLLHFSPSSHGTYVRASVDLNFLETSYTGTSMLRANEIDSAVAAGQRLDRSVVDLNHLCGIESAESTTFDGLM